MPSLLAAPLTVIVSPASMPASVQLPEDRVMVSGVLPLSEKVSVGPPLSATAGWPAGTVLLTTSASPEAVPSVSVSAVARVSTSPSVEMLPMV